MLRLSFPLAALAALAPAQDKQDFKGLLPLVPGATNAIPIAKTLVFEMREDGTVRHGGKTISADQLKEAFEAFAKKHPDPKRKIGGLALCEGNLHMRLHPNVPSEALLRVLLMSSQTLIYRVHVGVRSEKDGTEKALRLFLPVGHEDFEKGMLDAKVRFANRDAKTAILAKQFARAAKKYKCTALVFHADANVTIASIARIASIALSQGFQTFTFSGLNPVFKQWNQGTRDFRKLVAAMPERPARSPGVALSRAVPIEEVEEVEEEEVEEEEVVGEQDAKAKQAKNKKKITKVNIQRSRPPTKAEVPSKIAIGLALDWLAKHQDADGRWDADGFMKHDKGPKLSDGKGQASNDVGVTGLALLAFLGDGNTMRSGPYKDVVKKSVKWLRAQQGANGRFGPNASHDFIYGHAIATLAMVEAYGLSQYRLLRKNAQMGINYLESHRNPYSLWRYQPRDNDNDCSVSSWCLMAYKSGQDFGLEVNKSALKHGLAFLDMLTDGKTGRCGYSRRGEPSSRSIGGHATRFPTDKGEAMTGAGLFMRFMLGQDPKRIEVMQKGAALIAAKPPTWKADGSIDFYYWYYGSYALYQMGGEHWVKWQKALTNALLPNQRKDKNFAGSWDPVSVWSHSGGRVYATAICALSLESVYRYSRLIK